MPRVLYSSGSALIVTGFTRDVGPPATTRLSTATDQVALGTATPVTGRKLTVLTTGVNQGLRAWLTAITDNVIDALVNVEATVRMQLTSEGLYFGPGSGAIDWSIRRVNTALAAIVGTLRTQGREISTTYVTHTASPYDVLTTDEFVGMDTTGGVGIIRLPVAITGRKIITSNTALLAVNNAVSVTPNGAETINGVNAVVPLTGTQSITLVGRTSVGWYVV